MHRHNNIVAVVGGTTEYNLYLFLLSISFSLVQLNQLSVDVIVQRCDLHDEFHALHLNLQTGVKIKTELL